VRRYDFVRMYAKAACCKADAHGLLDWCRNLDIVYTDEDGRQYCVFHAPRGKKGVSIEKFNKLIFQKIENTKIANDEAHNQKEICNLSDTIFEGDIDFRSFREKRSLPDIDFVGAQFSGEANFVGAQFSGEANFVGAQFSERANFWKAQFSGEANFWKAQFSKGASFSDVQFSGEANFVGAKFSRKARFGLAKFSREASFSDAQFSKGASFWKAQFSTEAAFYRTLFDKEVDFTHVHAGQALHFEEVNLSHVRLADTDVKRIDFMNCYWREKRGRRIIADETIIPRAFAGIKRWLKVLWDSSKKSENNG
jgi:uncharacterized protein YjbI with pentapeptide repeats